jgi:hypothetical protein
MSGPELAARLLALRPGLKVLLLSGDADGWTVVQHGIGGRPVGCPQKHAAESSQQVYQ